MKEENLKPPTLERFKIRLGNENNEDNSGSGQNFFSKKQRRQDADEIVIVNRRNVWVFATVISSVVKS